MIGTLISWTEKNGELSIFVDAAQANDFYSFLRRKNISCSQPEASNWVSAGIYIDSKGIKQVIWQTTHRHMSATGTAKDFHPLVNEWLDLGKDSI